MRKNIKNKGAKLLSAIKNCMRINKFNSGFTLVELLVIITIIGILATGARVVYANAKERSRDAIRLSDMNELSTAIKIFYVEKSHYPNNSDDGISNNGDIIYDGTSDFEIAISPYMSGIAVDPIHDGVDYYYSYDPAHLVDDPVGSCNGNGNLGSGFPLLGFNKGEVGSATYRKDTCSGPDQNLDNADYNRTFFE